MATTDDPDRTGWQAEADLLADGRELLERLSAGARWRHLYPDGPNLALLLAAYQELDRQRTIGRVGRGRRAHARRFRAILRDLLRQDVRDRDRRLAYHVPVPRLRLLPRLPPLVVRALDRVDPDARAEVVAMLGGQTAEPAASASLSGARSRRGLQQLREGIVVEALRDPAAIRGLHPQVVGLVESAQPLRRAHPVATFFLVKLPLQLVLAVLTLLNLAYVGAYTFFNDEVLGDFISKRVSGLLKGDLEIESIHWEGRLIVDLLTGRPSHAVVTGVTVWEPYKGSLHGRERIAAHAERIDCTIVLHEIIPWNRIGIPTVFEIPWVLHFPELEIQSPSTFEVRQYDELQPDGTVKRLIGLRDAFKLNKLFPPRRGLSFAVDDAVLSQPTAVTLDFADTGGWATALTFATARFDLHFSAFDPWSPMPRALPLQFGLSGRDGDGWLAINDVELELHDTDLARWESMSALAPPGDIAFEGTALAEGSRVHVTGAMRDGLARHLDPAREPLPVDGIAEWGSRTRIELEATVVDAGGLGDGILRELEIDEGTVVADGARVSAGIRGMLADPVYSLGAEGLTLDLFDESAWALDDVDVGLTISTAPVPQRWRDRFPADARRRVVVLDTLRGAGFDGTVELTSGTTATIVMPEEAEPWTMAADLALDDVNPGQLAPDDPELADRLRGALSGRVAVPNLVLGPRSYGPRVRPEPPPDPPDPANPPDPSKPPDDTESETALLLAALELDNVRLRRDRGPKDDGIPKSIRAEGKVVIGELGDIDFSGVTLWTDGARLRATGGVDGEVTALDSTHLELDVTDGDAFAHALALPKYFEELHAEMTVVGSLDAPSGSGGSLAVTTSGAGIAGTTGADMWMDRGVLHLRAPKARLYGGTGSVTVDAKLFERGTIAKDPEVRAGVSLQGVDLGAASAGAVGGVADIELEVGDGQGKPARFSRVQARGEIEADRLSYAGSTYRDAKMTFGIDRERLAIDRFVLPVHRPVSPAHAPGAMVRVGQIVADGTVGLTADPPLDLHVQAQGVPLSVVGDLLEVEVPVRGQIAQGTDLRVRGSMRSPSVEGEVDLLALSAFGIPLGSGRLRVTSEDVRDEAPLAAHRELRVEGELVAGKHGEDVIDWALDAVIAIGKNPKRGAPPRMSAQVDLAFDQVALSQLLRATSKAPAIEGRLEGLQAHVLTCSEGAPMLSDCVDEKPGAFGMQLELARAWARARPPGKKGKPAPAPAGDPCRAPGTLCSREPLVATIDGSMVRLDRPWKLATGGADAAVLEIAGSFDLDEPRESKADAAAQCVPPAAPSVRASTSAGGRGHASVEGAIDLAAVAPLLEAAGLPGTAGRLDIDLALDGWIRQPRVAGTIARGGAHALEIEIDPKTHEKVAFSDLDVRITGDWVLAAGTAKMSGQSLRFGQIGGDHTGWAFAGPCAGNFSAAADGAIGASLVARIIGDAEGYTSGSINLSKLVVTGRIGDAIDLDRIEGALGFFGRSALRIRPSEMVGEIELWRGRLDFVRCRGGSECPPDVEAGALALYIGGRDAAKSESAPSHALRARTEDNGEITAWGQTFLSPSLDRVAHTDIDVVLEEVPFRDFDATGRPALEGELTSRRLQLRGGEPLTLRGQIVVDRARYIKDAVQGVDILQLADDVDAPETPPPEIVRALQFDLRVDTDRPLRIENNIASGVEATVDLAVTGDYDNPDYNGRIDLEPGGKVDLPFLTGTYEVQRGRVTLLGRIEEAEVDIWSNRLEPVYIEDQPHALQLQLHGTLAAISWHCKAEGDTGGTLSSQRTCFDYLVFGTGDVQSLETDVQRFGGGGLAQARKPLQVVGHVTEVDLHKRATEAIPRLRGYVPEARVRLGQIGPEIHVGTPSDWFDFGYGRVTLGWDYTRGYPGFFLRQNREIRLRIESLDFITLEFSRRIRSYLNQRVVFDPLQQNTLELRFDVQVPSAR